MYWFDSKERFSCETLLRVWWRIGFDLMGFSMTILYDEYNSCHSQHIERRQQASRFFLFTTFSDGKRKSKKKMRTLPRKDVGWQWLLIFWISKYENSLMKPDFSTSQRRPRGEGHEEKIIGNGFFLFRVKQESKSSKPSNVNRSLDWPWIGAQVEQDILVREVLEAASSSVLFLFEFVRPTVKLVGGIRRYQNQYYDA